MQVVDLERSAVVLTEYAEVTEHGLSAGSIVLPYPAQATVPMGVFLQHGATRYVINDWVFEGGYQTGREACAELVFEQAQASFPDDFTFSRLIDKRIRLFTDNSSHPELMFSSSAISRWRAAFILGWMSLCFGM